VSESPFRAATPDPLYQTREQYGLREHSFIQNTDSQLDMFIAQGQEVLHNLVDQKNILKGTQKRLLDTANTLGLSREVIGWIERRRYGSTRFRGAQTDSWSLLVPKTPTSSSQALSSPLRASTSYGSGSDKCIGSVHTHRTCLIPMYCSVCIPGTFSCWVSDILRSIDMIYSTMRTEQE
jgi:hypothetical protein